MRNDVIETRKIKPGGVEIRGIEGDVGNPGFGGKASDAVYVDGHRIDAMERPLGVGCS